jgi:phospholipid/cholesterol/gamma-HCH transport system ATP-binding protein
MSSAATPPSSPATGAVPKAEPIISVRNLVKKFGEKIALNGVNLDVYPGETLVIMGGSGCGKSTLLRCIIGAEQFQGGQVMMFGKSLGDADEAGRDEVRKKFGILFQSGALFNSMSVADNVALPLREHTDLADNIIDLTVRMKLNSVGLLSDGHKLPSEISGGMKKRAGLARAMALDPKILFCDEPSAGLDPVTSAEIDRLILNMTRGLGVTCVVVTHEMDSAFTIADRMAMLDQGRMLRVDTRDWFDALRKVPEAEAGDLPEEHRLIRQFLRGDAEGPLTKRRGADNWADAVVEHEKPRGLFGKR